MDTSFKNVQNSDEEYPRFNNKIILGSKPCISLTKKFINCAPEQSKQVCDNEDVVETSPENGEVCRHCDKTFSDHTVLLKHLLEVAAKFNRSDVKKNAGKRRYSDGTILGGIDGIDDQNTALHSTNALKRAKKRKIGQKYCNKTDSVNIENEKYLRKSRECNKDFDDDSARVLKTNKHGRTERQYLKNKETQEKQRTSDEDSQSFNENNEEADENDVTKMQIQEESKKLQRNLLKIDDLTAKVNTTQNNLKRKLSQDGVASKQIKTKDKYINEIIISEELSSNEENIEVKAAKLFKCPCGIHYTSHKALQKHFKECYPAYKTSKQPCSKCGILFPTELLVDHLCKHHSKVEYKFEVVDVTPNLKIYRCEYCHTMFSNKVDLVKHFEKCTKNSDSGHSSNAIVSGNCAETLEIFNKANSTNEDESKKKEATLNKPRTSLQNDKTDENKQRNVNKQSVYKCYKCDIHYLTLPSIKYHFDVKHKLCWKVEQCEYCGLRFSSKSMPNHVYLHHTKMKCELKDLRVEIVDESTNFNKAKELKTDAPKKKKYVAKRFNSIRNLSLPQKEQQKTFKHGKKLYKSKFCLIHFMTKQARNKHMKTDHVSKQNCRKKSQDCKLCGYAFSFKTLPEHILIHHFEMKLKREDFRIVVNKSLEPLADNNNPKNNTEVLDRKIDCKSLYKCGKCTLHFLKSNTLYSHVSNDCTPHAKTKAVDCEICGLQFRTTSLKRHIYLHHIKMKLKLEDFSVLQLPIHKTSSSEITETKTFQFSGKKRYNLSTEYKTCLDKKSYDNHLYKCSECSLHFMRANTLARHFSCCSSVDENLKVICEICDLKFSAMTLPRHKYVHHKRMKLTRQDFAIVTKQEKVGEKKSKEGNPKKHAMISQHVDAKVKRGIPKKVIEQSNEKLSVNTEVVDNNAYKTSKHSTSYSKYLYKCNICSLHFMKEDTLNKHLHLCKKVKDKLVNAVKCSKCNINFKSTSMDRHRYAHHMKMKLTIKDLIIISKPQLNETEKNNFQNRLQSDEITCTNVRNIRTNLKVNEDLIEKNIDESTSDLPKSSNKEKYSNRLYKCHTCLLHFTGSRTYNKHMSESAHTELDAKCDICDLFFSRNNIERHKEMHHKILKLNREDFRIVNQIKKTNDSIAKGRVKINKKKPKAGKFLNISVTSKSNENEHSVSKKKLSRDKDRSLNTSVTCKLNDNENDHSVFKKNLSRDKDQSLNNSVTSKSNENEQNVSKKNLDNNIQSSRDKLQMAIDSIESSSDDINILRKTIAALSKNRKGTSKGDNQTFVDLSDSENNLPSVKEELCSLSVSELSCQTFDMSRVFTNLSEDLQESTEESASKCKRNSSKDEIQLCEDLNDLSVNTTPIEEEASSANVTELSPNVFIDQPDARGSSIKTIDVLETSSKDIAEPSSSYDNTPMELSVQVKNANVSTKPTYKRNPIKPIVTLKVSSTINTTKPSGQVIKYPGYTEPSEDYMKVLAKVGTSIQVLEQNGIESLEQTIQSSTPEPNNTSKIENKNPAENQILTDKAEIPNNITSSLLALTRKQDFKDVFKSYDRNLYKCEICLVYFSTSKSFRSHMSKAAHDPQRYKVCSICKYTFSSKSLKFHKHIHHSLLKLTREDFKITIDYRNISEDIKEKANKKDAAHVNTRPKELDLSLNIENNVTKSRKKNTNDSKHKVKLFKCGICNVYYIGRDVWIKHTTAHVPLQDKEYTKCKLCGLEFTIYSLHKHIKKHHKEGFKFENVLVEEYLKDGTVSNQTYCAIDRVQSKLVSTTTAEAAQNTTATTENISKDNQYTTSDSAYSVTVQDNQINIEYLLPATNNATVPTDFRGNKKYKCDTINNEQVFSESESRLNTSKYFNTNKDKIADMTKIKSLVNIFNKATVQNSNVTINEITTAESVKKHTSNVGAKDFNKEHKKKALEKNDTLPRNKAGEVTTTQDLDVIVIEDDDYETQDTNKLSASSSSQHTNETHEKAFDTDQTHFDIFRHRSRGCTVCGLRIDSHTEHLKVKHSQYTCCICRKRMNLYLLKEHAESHNVINYRL